MHRQMILHTRFVFPLLLIVVLASDLFADETNGPADVFIQVAVIRDELELLRHFMGRPKDRQLEIQVDGASPREGYFQAMTLLRKADRLCFEHTRERGVNPQMPEGVPTSADVRRVVEAALGRIRRIKEALGIDQSVTPPQRDPSKDATDVFRGIVQANRQLNRLLDKRFTPSDVYQQVTLGVACTSRLLERFPGATTLPESPPFEAGKQPSDVYRRLVSCFERIRTISERSGERVLHFRRDEQRIAHVEPSDVYDIASLLVSELAYLNAIAGCEPPREAYYPGRKFPSHVFQRAGLLEIQLQQLETLVNENPNWLQDTRPQR